MTGRLWTPSFAPEIGRWALVSLRRPVPSDARPSRMIEPLPRPDPDGPGRSDAGIMVPLPATPLPLTEGGPSREEGPFACLEQNKLPEALGGSADTVGPCGAAGGACRPPGEDKPAVRHYRHRRPGPMTTPRDRFSRSVGRLGLSGHPLREDSLAQLEDRPRRAGFRYVRFHAIFRDVLKTYRVVDGQPITTG